jgi:carbon storage regulator CsrA
MLILTRKNNEGVVVLDEEGQILVSFTVLKTTQGKAQVGIDALPAIKILRDELYLGEDDDHNRDAS